MPCFSVSHIRPAGLAVCVPANKVSNQDYPYLTQRERALLIKTTGIAYRHVCTARQCASDLCFEAAQQLLQALNWQKEDIGILIFVSQTPDYITPATAAVLQHRLALPHTCLAFDVNLGCSAYPYGLALMGSLLANMPHKKGLLLVGDALTRLVSEQDKSAAPLFSDAGSATALCFDPLAPPMLFNLQTDGSGSQAIMVPHGGARHPFTANSLMVTESEKGIARNAAQLHLNGLEIFNFGLREVAANAKELLHFAQTLPDDLDYAVFHQANKLLNDRIRHKLQLPENKTPSSLYHYGNTSSATIPLTMATCLQTSLTSQKLTLLLSGFGVGLSWGSALLRTTPMVCLPVIELNEDAEPR